jgi:hypothetical protein
MIVFIHNLCLSWREKTCLSKMSYICLSFLLFQLKNCPFFIPKMDKIKAPYWPSQALSYMTCVWLCVCSISEDTKGFYMRQAALRSSPPPPPFHVLKNEFVLVIEQEKVMKTTFFAGVINGSTPFPLSDNSPYTCCSGNTFFAGF